MFRKGDTVFCRPRCRPHDTPADWVWEVVEVTQWGYTLRHGDSVRCGVAEQDMETARVWSRA